MKTYLFLFAAIPWCQAVHAQAIPTYEVPPLAFAALQKFYPQARDVKWKKAQGWYQASYSQSQTHRLVRFSTKGEVEATGTAVALGTLPLPVRLTLTNHYPSRKVCQADQITDTQTGDLTYEMATCESYVSSTIVLTALGLKVHRIHQ